MPVSYIIALRELAKQKMKDEETKKQEQGMALEDEMEANFDG